MANLKNITDLPVVESAEGLNLIVEDNGSAKRIAASSVGAQADWNIEDKSNPAYIVNKPVIPAAQVQADWSETDETSMAFIKNKPIEEWDLDLTIDVTWNTETSDVNAPVLTAAEGYSYESFVAKIEAGEIPKVKFRLNQAMSADVVMSFMDGHCNVMCQPGAMYSIFVFLGGNEPLIVNLNPDGTFTLQG